MNELVKMTTYLINSTCCNYHTCMHCHQSAARHWSTTSDSHPVWCVSARTT